MLARSRLLLIAILTTLFVVQFAGVEPCDADGERKALIIGIDGYQKIRPLKYCVADAKLLRDSLIRNGFRRENVQLLTDDESGRHPRPTLSNIYDALDALEKSVRSEDTIFFAFSGHGMRDSEGEDYLMPIDASASSPQDTAIPLDHVVRRLRESAARRVLMSMDACRNLQEGKSMGGSGFGPTPRGLDFDEAGARALMMLYSCDTDEQSYEWEDKGHGVFTYYLVRAINGDATGEDAELTIGELGKYLYTHVSTWAGDRGYAQTPQLRYDTSGAGDPASSVFIVPGGIATVRGRVFEAGTDRPVADATVRVRKLELQTDEQGTYALESIRAGSLDIKVAPPDPYEQPAALPVTAYPGSELTIDIPLQRRDRGSISVNVRPWARVFLDGERVGDTPLTIPNVEPGEHVLSWRPKGLERETQQTVTVEAGKTLRITPDHQQPAEG